MKNTQKKLVLCRREDWMDGLCSQITLQQDTLLLDVSRHTVGFACIHAIDGGAPGFLWKRIQVGCRLPEGSTLRVYAYASDSKSWGEWPNLDTALCAMQGSYHELRKMLDPIFGEPVGKSGDFLVRRTGRYLWLMFELMSSGAESPAIESVTLWLEGDHMTDYLPAIYQNDDFTSRFMSVFNSMFLDMEQRIYDLPGLLDSDTADEKMLRNLASWVCLDGERATAEELRRWIPSALDDFENMYTVEGISRSIKRITGRTPILVEHHQVDPNSPTCINPNIYRKLYGDDPFRFFVLMDEDTFPRRDDIEDFLERMQTLIPAGTELKLILLKKCIQLDWHTYLGVNSFVGSYVPVAVDENTTIHFDTVIGG